MNKVINLNRKIKLYGINKVAKISGLHKSTVSRYLSGDRSYSLVNFNKLANAVMTIEAKTLDIYTNARNASIEVIEGEDWKISYFNFIDSLRETRNPILFADRPADGLPINLLAMLSSIVMTLSNELNIEAPDWAKLAIELEIPWFVTQFESLKATCLLESPIFFRRNNIFVSKDFLSRL